MRKTRSQLTGMTHPTIDDPSPLDFCGWCLNWIAEGDEPTYAPLAIERGASLADKVVVELWFDDHLLVAIVPGPGWDPGFLDAGAVGVLCSEECLAELEAAIARDDARARGEQVAPPTATAQQRIEAEAVLEDRCAWCRTPIPEDAPVETVSASLTGDTEPDGGMVGIDIGGRVISALVPPAGFPMREGHTVLFVLCSPACAKALEEAVRLEKQIGNPH